jgi:UDP:flavonoid glycosyltransferase YjiC (YdhE family)
MTGLVREMLGDERFTKAAERISSIYARADGPGAAADAILELCGARDGDSSALSTQAFAPKVSSAVA